MRRLINMSSLRSEVCLIRWNVTFFWHKIMLRWEKASLRFSKDALLLEILLHQLCKCIHDGKYFWWASILWCKKHPSKDGPLIEIILHYLYILCQKNSSFLVSRTLDYGNSIGTLSFIKATDGCQKSSPSYQFNILNFDAKKNPWDPCKTTFFKKKSSVKIAWM